MLYGFGKHGNDLEIIARRRLDASCYGNKPVFTQQFPRPGYCFGCEQKVFAALEAAGLRPAREFAFRYPHELSGGQRQRVVIAGALVLEPDLVVADEPVSMLDVSIRTELLRLMLELRTSRGLTYLFITHDLSLAWVIADRIAVMYLGKIMEIGPAERVISAPRHPYSAALVSVSFLNSKRQRVQRFLTQPVTGTHRDWVQVRLGPLLPDPESRRPHLRTRR
jgi:ABC-type oligopeptide transport system ATPase subunit